MLTSFDLSGIVARVLSACGPFACVLCLSFLFASHCTKTVLQFDTVEVPTPPPEKAEPSGPRAEAFISPIRLRNWLKRIEVSLVLFQWFSILFFYCIPLINLIWILLCVVKSSSRNLRISYPFSYLISLCRHLLYKFSVGVLFSCNISAVNRMLFTWNSFAYCRIKRDKSTGSSRPYRHLFTISTRLG